MKFVTSYSGGKDSVLALHRMIDSGNTPVALLATVNKDVGVSWFHGVDVAVLRAAAESLGMALTLAESVGNDYEAVLTESLRKSKKAGATHCVFGDIDIAEHRKWCERVAGGAGIEAVFPLWLEDRSALVNEAIGAGFSIIIKVIAKDSGLPKHLLGQTLNREVLSEITRFGADPCGENGEYHTFVWDGPIFHEPVNFETDGYYENENCYSIILKTAGQTI